MCLSTGMWMSMMLVAPCGQIDSVVCVARMSLEMRDLVQEAVVDKGF